MTLKQQVLEAIEELPENVSYKDIVDKIAFLAAVKKGIEAADRGDVVPLDEVRKMVPKWASK
jgi:predicted transcriptional regulator